MWKLTVYFYTNPAVSTFLEITGNTQWLTEFVDKLLNAEGVKQVVITREPEA